MTCPFVNCIDAYALKSNLLIENGKVRIKISLNKKRAAILSSSCICIIYCVDSGIWVPESGPSGNCGAFDAKVILNWTTTYYPRNVENISSQCWFCNLGMNSIQNW